MFTTCDLKSVEFFQWPWPLTIINFIIVQLFAKHRFEKNTSAWLLLTSKFFSEFDSMFSYHKVRMLQKGFSQLFFAWSVKWWVSLKDGKLLKLLCILITAMYFKDRNWISKTVYCISCSSVKQFFPPNFPIFLIALAKLREEGEECVLRKRNNSNNKSKRKKHQHILRDLLGNSWVESSVFYHISLHGPHWNI